MMDRLLGNAALHRERRRWYASLAGALLGRQRRVVVLVDWTQLHDELWALVAAVPFRGRSLPILACCHRKTEVGARSAHIAFLTALREVIPDGAQIVVVTDAGFRSTFFAACKRVGVDFVIRLRNDRAVARLGDAEQDRARFAEIFERAKHEPQCLGSGRPYATSTHSAIYRLVLGPKPRKANRRRDVMDDYERKRGCEPFLIATSLENEPARAIVSIYERRMQIEQVFRDAKSSRFGWALEHTKASTPRRFDVLLLLAAIAYAAVILIGGAGTALGLEKSLRASSIRRRVLSLFTVGNLVLSGAAAYRIRLGTVWKQLREIHAELQSLFPTIPNPISQGRRVRLPLPHDLYCADCGWKGLKYGWPA
jgi:DDE family transposase